MNFDQLDQLMRVYETTNDLAVLPNIWMVARIDGRSFTRLTKDVMNYQRPFDQRFRDAMISTVKHLMECGFPVLYGYTQSDEISLLLSYGCDVFGRKLRKYCSILAGEASGHFSLAIQQQASFDCRICQLPTDQLVHDYFRWRMEDAHRNALNAYCYWTLRDQALDPQTAHRQIATLSVAQKNELLFQHGINFNDLVAWQKRGIGFYWQTVDHQGYNPQTQMPTLTQRRKIHVEFELPQRETYSNLLASHFDR